MLWDKTIMHINNHNKMLLFISGESRAELQTNGARGENGGLPAVVLALIAAILLTSR